VLGQAEVKSSLGRSQCLCLAEFLRRWSRSSGKRRGSGGNDSEEQMAPSGRGSGSRVMSQESGSQGAAKDWPSLQWSKRNELAISEINGGGGASKHSKQVVSSSRFDVEKYET